MHIQIVSLNYYPDRLGNAPILTNLATGLAQRGHRVQVLCALPHHETGAIDPEWRGRLWQREQVQGVDVLRVWIATGEGRLGKLANYASFTAIAALAGSLLPRPDLLLSPSPPITLGLVDALLAQLKRVPFVFNLQDVFPDVAVEMGQLSNPRAIELFRRIERFTYNKAARIAVISEGMRAQLLRKGVPAERIALVPNCVDVEGIQPVERSRLRASLGLEGQFVVGFSGRIGSSQGLEHVIEAAELLREEERLSFLIIGSGSERARIEGLAKEKRLTRVHFLPTQPREELSDSLGAADLHLVPLRRGLANYSVPSKLLGVMAAGRPALACLEEDSDAARLVRRAGCGEVVPPEDPAALAAALRAAMAAPDRGAAQGAAGRSYLLRELHPRQMIDRYEALFQAVLSEASAGGQA